MALIAGALISAVGTAYSANQAGRAADAQSDAARRAGHHDIDLAEQIPRPVPGHRPSVEPPGQRLGTPGVPTRDADVVDPVRDEVSCRQGTHFSGAHDQNQVRLPLHTDWLEGQHHPSGLLRVRTGTDAQVDVVAICGCSKT